MVVTFYMEDKKYVERLNKVKENADKKIKYIKEIITEKEEENREEFEDIFYDESEDLLNSGPLKEMLEEIENLPHDDDDD